MSEPSGTGQPAGATPAPAVTPQLAPPEYFHDVAVEARAKIEALKGDKAFYKELIAESASGNAGGPANTEWKRLHSVGWPAPQAVASPHDVAKQQDARTEQAWSEHIAALQARFGLTPAQEAEIRGGRINTEAYKWAVNEKDRLVKDRGFYRRLLDGDRAAARDWGLIQAMLALRPVDGFIPPSRR